MGRYALVDSGTSTTRVRLWQAGAVQWTGTRAAGARDTAVEGHAGRVREALRDLLDELGASAGNVDAAVCSGMITSNVGLVEVPHLQAPVTPDALAQGIVSRALPEVAPVPFHFIPGVKTLPPDLDLWTLATADLMRGEEVECVGLREALALEGPTLFLHFGSHHKAIDVDGAGTILGSRTALTGELLDAVVKHTILSDSLGELDSLSVDHASCRAGFQAAREHGLGRALFLVRVGDKLVGLRPDERFGFLFGALASLDVPLVDEGAADATIVPYGGGGFGPILAEYFAERGYRVVPADRDAAEWASAVGAAWLMDRYGELMAGEGTGS